LNYAQLAVFGFMVLLCLVIYFLGTLGFGGDIIKRIGDRMAHYGEWSWRRENNAAAVAVVITLILIRLLPYFLPMQGFSPEQYIRFLGGWFPLFGAPIGALVSNTLYSFRMSWNMDEIIDVCRAYTYRRDNRGMDAA
jgi:branched-subunit amino acid transport protein AzlD